MKQVGSFVLVLCLAGCGSTIGTLDELPDGPDVSAAEWPRLVDTPEPPEARLIAGTGERAAQRLGVAREQAGIRLASAGAVPPVSDALLSRGAASRARSDGAVAPAVDEAALLARAERLRQRTATELPAIDEAGLMARAAAMSGRGVASASAAVETAALAPVAAPRPLRPLDAPVVSSGFEARARQAQERARRALQKALNTPSDATSPGA